MTDRGTESPGPGVQLGGQEVLNGLYRRHVIYGVVPGRVSGIQLVSGYGLTETESESERLLNFQSRRLSSEPFACDLFLLGSALCQQCVFTRASAFSIDLFAMDFDVKC